MPTSSFLRILFLCCFAFRAFSQENNLNISAELLLGHSAEANSYFPKRKIQKQFTLGLHWNSSSKASEQFSLLNLHSTGLLFGVTDLGNASKLGFVYSLMPFVERGFFKGKKYNFNVNMAFGMAYVNQKYHINNNPFNKALSTDLNWSYRIFLSKSIFKSKSIDWRAGISYHHQSNGHTKLPNQGINSFLGGINAHFLNSRKDTATNKPLKTYKSQSFVSARMGLGYNIFSESYNELKPVYTVDISYGKIYNKVLKISLGMYARFYTHYYDYINDNEYLVQEGQEFEGLKSAPFLNATTYGVHLSSEVLIHHIGMEFQFGVNFFKPAYNIDWRINEGHENAPREIPEGWKLGEYSSYFELKKHISSRMGLKYYILNTQKSPRFNFYIGAHINANLGQADFSELSLGYIRRI